MTSISDTNVVNAPGGLVEVAFQQRTTEYITSSTTVSGASNIFNSNATFIADGSPYIVDFFCGRIITYGPYTNIYLVDGSGNSLGMFGLVFPGDNQVPGFYRYRFVPAAGTVVNLNIRGIVNTTGSATYGAGDGGTGTGNQMPMQLRVSKIIQASQLIVQTPNVPLVTSLPSNAIDGQEVRYLADNTNGIIWNFRYRAGSSSSYKWEFIGGIATRAFSSGVGSLTSSSYSTNFSNGATTITVPLTGDYDVKFGARELFMYGASNGIPTHLNIGTSAPGDNIGACQMYSYNANATYWSQVSSSVFSNKRLAGVNAGATISMYGRSDANQMGTNDRYINLTPIRVSA